MGSKSPSIVTVEQHLLTIVHICSQIILIMVSVKMYMFVCVIWIGEYFQSRHNFFCTTAYHVPNWEINNIGVMSHKPPYATFRGPGKGPAIFIMESMIDHLATSLNLDVENIKRMNLYRIGQVDILSVIASVSQSQIQPLTRPHLPG